ncbi:protein SIX6OS1-like protein, partial [Corchorus olitorius]
FAVGALQLLDHGQARTGRAGVQLPPRHHARRRRAAGAWPGGVVQRHRFPGGQGAVPLRWRRHHPGDVDGALVLRHQRQRRHGVRAQRPFAEGHHLPPRAGTDGVAHSQLQPAHHLREAWAG